MRTFLLLAIAMVFATVAAGSMLLPGPTETLANHEAPGADGECNIPGGGTVVGNDVSNEPCVADYVALDANPTGNTASSLGSFEDCVSVATSAAFAVDLAADAVPDVGDPTLDGIGAWQALIQYDSNLITLGTVDRTAAVNLLGTDPDSNLLNPAPTELQAGPPRVIGVGSQDIGGGLAAEEAIGGTMARLNFTAGDSSGLAQITLLESFGANVTKLITVDLDEYGIGNFAGGESAGQYHTLTIAIGQGCPLPPDPGGPTTSNVQAAPNPTNGASTVGISANVSDVASGNRNIIAAELFIDSQGADGAGTAMAATDGAFDEPIEIVALNLSTSGLSIGDHTIYVHGQDSEGNWGTSASTILTVSDVPAGAETATLSVTGGALFLETNPVAFGSVQLTGSEQTVDTQPAAWRAGDATGTGAGWNVSITSTDFVSGSNSIAVDNFMVKIDQVNVVTETGNAPPQSQVSTYQSMSSTTPLKLLSAASGTGMGSYQFTPDFRVVVPADAGTGDYEAFMTVTINSGP